MTKADHNWQNQHWDAAKPVLSVLIPVYRDDPTPLLMALNGESAHLNGRVEILVLDDGSQDTGLTNRITNTIDTLQTPTKAHFLQANVGRSKGRNQLASLARGDWLLFLDGDMLPDSPAFLQTYLALACEQIAPVIFGGYSTLQVQPDIDTRLHVHLAQSTECVPAVQRNSSPARYLCTSNLLVQKSVFSALPYDEGFVGWGWEDVEWALRAEQKSVILHVDNTATHLGLDSPEQLIHKFEQSARNYAHMATIHPDAMAKFSSFKVANALKPLPMKSWLKAAFRGIAKTRSGIPVRIRAFALKLYKSTLYSEQLST